MYKNVELRKLPIGSLCTVAEILETNNDWKKVMSLIPRNPRSDYFEPKYNSEHIKLIEDAARQTNRKCAEILFDEWGTSGRIRPTLSTLKDVVQKAEIYRAADELARLLEESPPTRPETGPAAPVPLDLTLMLETNYHRHNDTTAQMKSNNQEQKSIGNKTTAQMQSLQNPLSDDSNLPDFSALNVNTHSQNGVDITNNKMNGYQTSLPNIEISVTNAGISTEILMDEKLTHFEYKDLEKLTKRFAERLIYLPDPTVATEEGQVQGKLAGKIGSGGFGDVYVGWHSKHGHIAVKKARQLHYDRKPEIAMRTFNAEVKFLSQFRHKNIVAIIGFSMDGPSLCIVSEYIDGGSLEQKLAAKILTKNQRLNILVGTAEGLRYLHSSEKPMHEHDPNPVYKMSDSDQSSKKNNFVHGDVKTANILLTRDCVPKLCDFGLAKQYETTFITSCPMGTSAYMAPEGFAGTITQKIDIYSFGIVMLEVLTGLKPLISCNGEKINIKDYVEDCCPSMEISHLLDPFIAQWGKAKDLFTLAKNCLERQRKSRPTSEEICDSLYRIRDNDDNCNSSKV
ncbi:hypothetical protein O0L34_g4326 [Tuta absoluta]|nr:hypothetical protein O0L34_g4326 [Tuta absoluta]